MYTIRFLQSSITDRGSRRSRWHPGTWGWKKWAIIAITFLVVIIAIIVGAVLGVRANAYPDYTALSYSLKDTYEGESFFDNFNYFTGYGMFRPR